MGSILTQTLMANIDTVRNNPSSIQRIILNGLDQVMDGTVDVVDATNPFVFLLEGMCVIGAAGMMRNRVEARDQYPSLAVTEDQVYKWMSDRDYVNRFATPTKATFMLFLDKEELIAKAVPTGSNGVKQLTIPRHTSISVAGYEFTMQYPIDIRVMPYGDLQVTYDSSRPSPLQQLPSNLVKTKTVPLDDGEFVVLTFEVIQMSLASYRGKVNLATGFTKTYTYSDYFYFARAYVSDNAGNWNEIAVSYNPQVFDINKPTILATVKTGQVTFSVPQIYLTNGSISTEVRLDIYTTKGPLQVLLSNFLTEQYTAKWQDFDNSAQNVYAAPLNNFTRKGINSSSVISGGAGPMTFAQLRAQVIDNTMGEIKKPITSTDLSAAVSDRGYGLVTNVDNITNRQFLVTRSLPAPSDGAVVTGAGCTINTFQTTLEALSGIASVADNGPRITLLPKTLYRLDNGVVSIVPQAQIDDLLAQDLETRVQLLNASDYLYTPFHYVLDTTGDLFEARAYYLDDPTVNVKAFVTENASTDITVATNTYRLVRTDTGYQLQVTVKSSDSYKALPDAQCFAQLCYVPIGETDYAYLNGTLVGQIDGERVFGFDLDTNFDINSADQLTLTSFSMYNEGPRQHRTPMTATFQMVYGVTDYQIPGQVRTSIDDLVGDQLLTGVPVGVTQEVYEMELGYALTGLWTNSRSVASASTFATHTADVPMTYKYDVFLTDPATGAPAFTIDPDSQQPVFTVLHHAGDPMLDIATGAPLYEHRMGDVIRDGQGNPVQLLPRSIARQIDLLMIDGVYWWATASNALTYRDQIPTTLVGWIQDDVVPLQEEVLENTELYFYPKSTVGLVKVVTQTGSVVTIDAEQSFDVTYYLTEEGYRNNSLTDTLRKNTKTILAKQLSKATVTRDALITALKEAASSDVISLDIHGLGGSLNLSALKMVDESMRLTIAKVNKAMPDGTIGVDDAINVNFIPFN